MTSKRKPHHDLAAIKVKFGTAETLEITTTALRSARALGFALDDVAATVQLLERSDFVKSETAHNPANSRVWHDSYVMPFDGLLLYLKFAGETLVDVVLTSFKEKD